MKCLCLSYLLISITFDTWLSSSARQPHRHTTGGGLHRYARNAVVHQYAKAAQQHLESIKAARTKRDLASIDDLEVTGRESGVKRVARATPDCPIPPDSDYNCDPATKYRAIDGTCNNLQHPKWGGSDRGVARFVPSAYGDGIGTPRVAHDGQPLPDARAVCLALMQERSRVSSRNTLLHMTFGQLLAHDILHTPEAKVEDESGDLVSPSCGDDGCSSTGAGNEECLPIPVQPDDPDFTGVSCIKHVRSAAGFNDDCSNTDRTQMNSLTSWVDATHVYGPTADVEDKMRDKSDPSRGKLILTPHPTNPALKGLLPVTDGACSQNETIKCFVAGDGRANEHVGLSSFHTLWQRAHNMYEEQLHQLNPHWDGQRLYDETRKLVIGVWQHLVHNEYLPTLLGNANMKKFKLSPKKSGFFTGYDPTVNPDITSAFTSAAFRFGHSQIGEKVKFTNSQFTETVYKELSHFFKNPTAVYDTGCPGGSGVDAIMLGQLTEPSQETDMSLTNQLTAHLFTPNPPHGMGQGDLGSINVHRGREHGVPGYLEYRRFCGLKVGDSFETLHDISYPQRMKLKEVYRHVEDIDLFIGGLAENHQFVGIIGNTFACIIAHQFSNIKLGDRFYYENEDPVTGFSIEQLDEIRKMTLSRVMCDNLDFIDTIQKYALLQPVSEMLKMNRGAWPSYSCLMSRYKQASNDRQPCNSNDIESMDLTHWREDPPS